MFFSTNPLVTHHEENKRGRDFVVGDLHGMYGTLQALLRYVDFQPETDRLFSTGDLVDRGPDSLKCLHLLEKPWFYPVLGNHDAMLIAYLTDYDGYRHHTYAKAFVYNGGLDWLNDDYPAVLPLLPQLQRIPFVRVVGKDTPSRFQVLHAERLIGDEPTKNPRVLSDATLDSGVFSGDTWYVTGFDMRGDWFDALLWGRSLRFGLSSGEIQSGLRIPSNLSRTFVGHTITVPREKGTVLEYAHHIFLDFGAFDSGKRPDMGLLLWDVQGDCGYLYHDDSRITRCVRAPR